MSRVACNKKLVDVMNRVLRSAGIMSEVSEVEAIISKIEDSVMNDSVILNDSIVETVSESVKSNLCDSTHDMPGISREVMLYLENLLKTHEQHLSERFAATEEKLLLKIERLESKLDEKEQIVLDLQTQNVCLQTKVTEIESKVAIVQAVNNNLIIEQDDLQQHGRRTNIRIDGIEYDEHETQATLKRKIENTLKSVKVEIRDDLMERFHRSSAPYVYKGKRVAQVIVRLRYWKQRFQAQRAKKIARDNKLPIFIRNDLTQRRLTLLKKAVEKLPKKEDVFAFADVNSNLVIRNGDDLRKFNTEDELAAIIQQI